MDWLLSTLLKLSRLDAGMVEFQREQIAVEQLLAHAVRPLAIALELREITLQKSVPKGMVLQGDASWLSEALQNILKNCMQSIGSSGRIEILGSDTFLYSELVIHDSGAGFCEEELGMCLSGFTAAVRSMLPDMVLVWRCASALSYSRAEPLLPRITRREALCLYYVFQSDKSLTKKSPRCKANRLCYR